MDRLLLVLVSVAITLLVTVFCINMIHEEPVAQEESVLVYDVVSLMDGGLEYGDYIVKDIHTYEIVSITRDEDDWLFEEVVEIAPCDDDMAVTILIAL